jgi:signal transduction histidine kinase
VGWLRTLGARIHAAFESPVRATPPMLRRYQSVWRYALALLIGVTAWLSVAEAQASHAEFLFFLDPALGIVAFLLLPFRRRWPLRIGLAIAAIASVSTLAVGPLALSTTSLATRRREREIIPVYLVAVIADAFIYAAVQPEPASGSLLEGLVFGAIGVGIVVAIGMYIGARRDLVATLRERALRAEQDQALRVSQAQATERERIAREMHDVLAHRISRIAMHAGALAYRTDLEAAEAQQAAELIQADAHGALRELRSVLGVLRDHNDGVALRPQPTLADVEQLVLEARAAGMRVRVEPSLSAVPDVPEAVGRNAYRIIQEGLTNAAKHAPGTSVVVRLDHTAGGELAVEVCNPLPVRPVESPPGSGLGLIGLTERATLAGGRIEHGVRGGNYLIRAWLPVGAE